jgi:hypothetical protein
MRSSPFAKNPAAGPAVINSAKSASARIEPSCCSRMLAAWREGGVVIDQQGAHWHSTGPAGMTSASA